MSINPILKIIPTTLFLVTTISISGQIDSNRAIWFNDLEKAFKNPERVYNLDLSNRGLDSIPSYIDQFYNIEALKLSDNNITEVGEKLNGLRKLKFLELSGNKIIQIDFEKMADLKYTLEELWLRDNKIVILDSTINHLPSLKRLNLGQNKITDVDTNIVLKYLESISLDNNYISDFPKMTINSRKLRELNLNSNNIQSINISNNLINLEKLNIGNNPVKNLNIEAANYKLELLIMDWIDLSKEALTNLPNSIKTLSIEHCNLDSVPKAIYMLRNLEELSLIQNNMEDIPIDLLNLRQIKKIWIGGNPIKPDSLDAFLDKKGEIEIVE